MRLSAFRPTHRSICRATSMGFNTRESVNHRRLLCEPLECRLLLSLGPALAALPGMHLADPSVDRFDGQVVYLDFDGARDVTYNGPVVIEGIDVPSFRLPGALAGREAVVIDGLVDQIEGVFGDTGIAVTARRPAAGEYSTVYVGGDGSAFQQYGSFLGLAEQTDVGNRDRGDSAFVFSETVLAGESGANLPEVVVHEIGHLLGYDHDCNDIGTESELAGVAYKGSTHKFLVQQASGLYKALFGVAGVTLEHEHYLEGEDDAWWYGGDSLCEGAIEEDLPPTRAFNHFCAGGDEDELFDGLDVGGWVNTPLENVTENRWPNAVSEYEAGDKALAYWWLGRIMHLVQDSTVPAHVHKDPHPGEYPPWVGGDDQYEEDANGLNVYFEFNTEEYGTSWDYQDWSNNDRWNWSVSTPSYSSFTSSPQALWDRSDDYGSLEALFRETTDYTDDYDSDDRDGDVHGGGGPSFDGAHPGRLAEMDRSLHDYWARHEVDGSWSFDLSWAECRVLARDLGTWAVEQSVMLMRYFYNCREKLVASPTNAEIVNTSTGSIELGWEPVDGADGYVVYRSDGDVAGFSRVGSSSEPRYADTGLEPGADQYYRVYAYNDVAGLGSGYASVSAASLKPVSTLIDEDDGDYLPGDFSLREALILAASTPGKDVIEFAPELAGGTITLNAGLGQLEIASDVDVMGLGATELTIDAAGNSRVFYVDPAVTDATVSGLTITGGSVLRGAGISNEGTLWVVNSTISGNVAWDTGGGIDNRGTLSVANSTISNNSGPYRGGGISNLDGTVTVANSTISGNSAYGYGGGIDNDSGTVTVINSTISGNSVRAYGGGLYTWATASTTLHNTIVAGNLSTDTGLGQDLGGDVVQLESSYNLVGDAASSGGLADGVRGNIVGQAPLLAPLGYYGGPTKTHALLLPGSPAIDAGHDAWAVDPEGNPLTTDQRGEDFSRILGSAVDIGAFEPQLIVSTLLDEEDDDRLWGDLSLREALDLAAIIPGKDVIKFAPELAGGTITLNGDLGQLQITSDLELLGRDVTIDAAGNSRVFRVGPGVNATLRDLTITRGGSRTDSGGGIFNRGTLHLVHSTISDSFAGFHGGGIYNSSTGRLVVENSTISGNSANGNAGGILNEGTLTVDHSTIAQNIGDVNANGIGTCGGIFNSGTLLVIDSTVSRNGTPMHAGGIHVDPDGDATVINSTISCNYAYGDGGGIRNCGTLSVLNSTIADNTADENDNGTGTGGGVYTLSGGVTTLHNTIVAGNRRGATAADDLLGEDVETDSSYNLVGDTDSSGGLTGGVNGNIVGQDPLMAPLGDCGGTMQTHALLPGSPAIDAGNDAWAVDPLGHPLTTDQRGESFARVFGDSVDMGAFERQTIVVSTLVDEEDGDLRRGDFSLREALALAHAIAGKDVIQFAPDLAGGTITLDAGSGQLEIASDLDLMGGDATALTIDAAGNSRVFHVHGAVADATISGLKVTGGGGVQRGAGILNEGTLSVVDSVISGNSADSHGGGMESYGVLSVVNSTISQNWAGVIGGGIINHGELSVVNSTISHNRAAWTGQLLDQGTLAAANSTIPAKDASVDSGGGGICNDATGEVFVVNSTISFNAGYQYCGGILNEGTFSLLDSTVLGNVAHFGGGIHNLQGTLSVAGSTIARNVACIGGGILNESTLSVIDSTISGNATYGIPAGGGIANIAELSMVNSTISGNSSGGSGGGILNAGTLSAVNSTITENTADADDDDTWEAGEGGGVCTLPDGSTTLHNVIVARNVRGTAAPVADDLSGDPVVAGSSHNLIDDAGTSGGLADGVNGNIVGVEDLSWLTPLADHGGPTQTHALLPASPAIDVGDDGRALDPDGHLLTTDQRGEGFDRVVGSAVDIGAFEYKLLPAAVTARLVFYNNSAFDGNDPAANQQDEDAIALDKRALLPGGTATFANCTSYSRGINGIIMDVAKLAGTPTATDFLFKVGNDNDPSGWTSVVAMPEITVQAIEDLEQSYRITLIWPDYAIQKQWLQVTVLATANTGLAEPDVFYFGNAVADAGNSTTDAKVNATDMLLARNNPRTFLDPAAIDFPYDYNRDGRVNATDMLIARNNQTHFLNALKLITVPALGAAKEEVAGDAEQVSEASSANPTWLYELALSRRNKPSSKEAESIDQLLAIYGQ
ncbi:MAG: hypothetical protein JXB62_09345 [Pirellulales bacterium]|nr:hypothetical protein [Pirellulales bacterium]